MEIILILDVEILSSSHRGSKVLRFGGRRGGGGGGGWQMANLGKDLPGRPGAEGNYKD